MDNYTNGLLIGAVFGIPLGLYVALVSNRHDKVLGGMMAQIFHVLGVVFVAATMPLTLVLAFSRVEFLPIVLTAVGTIILGFVMLLIYAVFETPAREAVKHDDRGWTAEKAKSSGL